MGYLTIPSLPDRLGSVRALLLSSSLMPYAHPHPSDIHHMKVMSEGGRAWIYDLDPLISVHCTCSNYQLSVVPQTFYLELDSASDDQKASLLLH